MNIFHIDDKIFITKMNQFSKHLFVYSTHSISYHQKLEEIIIKGDPKCIITNSGTIFTSNNSMIGKDEITQVTSSIHYPNDKTEVKLAHSTLINLIHCLTKHETIQRKFLKYEENHRFEPNDVIFLKTHHRRKPNSYEKHIVRTDRGNTILTTKNMEVPKNRIRRSM